MTKVSVLYPNNPGARFDMDYYLKSHIPMVQRLLAPAIRNVTVDEGKMGAALGTSPAYQVICTLYFDSIEAFGMAFMPVAGQVQGDISNYTDIVPVIQINEAKLG